MRERPRTQTPAHPTSAVVSSGRRAPLYAVGELGAARPVAIDSLMGWLYSVTTGFLADDNPATSTKVSRAPPAGSNEAVKQGIFITNCSGLGLASELGLQRRS